MVTLCGFVLSGAAMGRADLVDRLERAQDGHHIDTPGFEYFQSPSVEIVPVSSAAGNADRITGPETLNIDGELGGWTPCSCSIVPTALKVFA